MRITKFASIFACILFALLFLAVPVFAQNDTNLADLQRDDGVTLHIESFAWQDEAGSFTPANGVYLIMLMTIDNPTDDQQCIRASNIRLLYADDEYPPERALMGAVQRELKPRRDYVGPLSGQCVDAGESAPSFAAFDVPLGMETFAIRFDDVTQSFAGTDDIVAVESTPAPVSDLDDSGDAQKLLDAIALLAGGRDVAQVQIADGRAKGGVRTALIAYTNHEHEDAALVEEFMDIFEAAASAIKVDHLDLDTVALIVGSEDDKALGVIEAQVDDLMDYHAGKITRAQFISKITFTSF